MQNPSVYNKLSWLNTFFYERNFIDSKQQDNTSEHKNQSAKNIRGRHSIKVNNKKSKNKLFKVYIIDNLKMFRIPKIPNLMKHINK